MSIPQNQHTVLNEVQISLLRLFNQPMDMEETLRLKRVLVNYYAESLTKEVENTVQEKGYTPEDIENMLNDAS